LHSKDAKSNKKELERKILEVSGEFYNPGLIKNDIMEKGSGENDEAI